MNIHDEITIPGQEARRGGVPAWLADSPVWPAVKAQTGGDQLFLHQATGLELLGQGHPRPRPGDERRELQAQVQ